MATVLWLNSGLAIDPYSPGGGGRDIVSVMRRYYFSGDDRRGYSASYGDDVWQTINDVGNAGIVIRQWRNVANSRYKHA